MMLKKNNLGLILEKIEIVYKAYMGKLEIRKCVIKAVDDVIGNKEVSVFCSMLGITKKDYIDYLEKEYIKVNKNK